MSFRDGIFSSQVRRNKLSYNRFTSGVFAAFLLLFAVVSTTGAQAGSNNQVLLTSRDGTMEMVGDLLSAENDMYTIRTRLGEISISAKNVFCFGDACPQVTQPTVFVDDVRADFSPESMPSYALIHQPRETKAGPFRLVAN